MDNDSCFVFRVCAEEDRAWTKTGEYNSLPEKYPVDSEVGVPFYDINVTASITESFNDVKEKPSYKINVPFLNDSML